MITTIARFISFITHPLFILIPVPFVLVYKTTGNLNYSTRWSIYTLVFLFLLVGIGFYLIRKGVFVDIDVSKREQRPLLFLICAILASIYIAVLFFFKGPPILLITMIGILCAIFIATALNTKIKASFHVATISSLTFALSLIYGEKYWIILIAIPIVGWARVKIKRHTVTETIAGAILGIVLSVTLYTITKRIL